MTKIDRLIGTIIILACKDKVTARELADTFEVSLRTVYRDIQSLSEIGIPVIAEPGMTGGYSLPDSYSPPTAVLSAAESQAVYLALNFFTNQLGFPLAEPSASALRKLRSFVPDKSACQAGLVADSILIKSVLGHASQQVSNYLHLILQALMTQKSLRIEYLKPGTTTNTIRTVDPYRLVYTNNTWYLEAYCHLREAIRMFKLLRIKQCRLTALSHKGPVNCADSKTKSEEEIIVRVRQESLVSIRIKESLEYSDLIRREDHEWIYLHFPVSCYSTPYLIRIVLSWGHHAEIVWPERVRSAIIAEIEAITARYR